MEIPVRDLPNLRGSQSGQAIIEYILVLVVTVALILGGLYQLNTAFKVWAKGYFGDYVSCLLETGELPDIGGAPGDSTVCKEAFKEFSQADGGPGIAGKGKPKGDPNEGRGGNREGHKSSGGGGGGGGSNGSKFAAGSNFGKGGGSNRKRGGSDSNLGSNTGNTAAQGGYGGTTRARANESKDRLDNRFAFDNESADKSKKGRSFASNSRSAPSPEAASKVAGKSITQKSNSRDKDQGGDTGMTFGNFIRYLVIAAIIIALVLLIGGQMLQVGKSME